MTAIDDYEDFCDDSEPPPIEAAPTISGRPCESCGGMGLLSGNARSSPDRICTFCTGIGYFGLDVGPVDVRPGHALKVAVLAARYQLGLDLFDARDAGPYGRNRWDRDLPPGRE